jgi:hypothetical protein
LLLDRFREIDAFLEPHPPRGASQSEIDTAEEIHDDFMGIFAGLPGHDIGFARGIYEALTNSDDPRDRHWAATFYSRMLPVDKPMGLSMLGRLIGPEETEHDVMDTAWEQLTGRVADDESATLREVVEYIDAYHDHIKRRATARITHARGMKSG